MYKKCPPKKQPRKAIYLLLPSLILIHKLFYHVACLMNLIIRDLYERSWLFYELGLETLNYSKHAFSKERKVEVCILPLNGVEDLLSPEINVSVLEVEVFLALIKALEAFSTRWCSVSS